MAAYYNDLVTEKSWQTLLELRRKLDFILIGGWAVYLYTRALKSKDIDIIVNFDVLSKLREEFQVVKNERLMKYEARREEVQIDVYLPYYSDIGMPVEKVIEEQKSIEGFKLVLPEALLVLKLLVFKKRGLSAKGQKDKIDVLSLLNFSDLDLVKFQRLVEGWNMPWLTLDLEKIVSETIRIPELGINEHRWRRKKSEIGRILNFVA